MVFPRVTFLTLLLWSIVPLLPIFVLAQLHVLPKVVCHGEIPPEVGPNPEDNRFRQDCLFLARYEMTSIYFWNCVSPEYRRTHGSMEHGLCSFDFLVDGPFALRIWDTVMRDLIDILDDCVFREGVQGYRARRLVPDVPAASSLFVSINRIHAG
jgi:hypothetical protein